MTERKPYWNPFADGAKNYKAVYAEAHSFEGKVCKITRANGNVTIAKIDRVSCCIGGGLGLQTEWCGYGGWINPEDFINVELHEV